MSEVDLHVKSLVYLRKGSATDCRDQCAQTQTHSNKTLGVCVALKLSQAGSVNFSAVIYFVVLCINRSDTLLSAFSLYANTWRQFHLDLSTIFAQFSEKTRHQSYHCNTQQCIFIRASNAPNRFLHAFPFWLGYQFYQKTSRCGPLWQL